MNEDAIIEAIIVGLLTVIVGIMVSHTVKHFNESTCDPQKHDCDGKNMQYFVFFLTGVVIYYFCELSGINDTYCRKKYDVGCATQNNHLLSVMRNHINDDSVHVTRDNSPSLSTLNEPFDAHPSKSVFIKFSGVDQRSPFEDTSPVMSMRSQRSPISLFNSTEQTDTTDTFTPMMPSIVKLTHPTRLF